MSRDHATINGLWDASRVDCSQNWRGVCPAPSRSLAVKTQDCPVLAPPRSLITVALFVDSKPRVMLCRCTAHREVLYLARCSVARARVCYSGPLSFGSDADAGTPRGFRNGASGSHIEVSERYVGLRNVGMTADTGLSDAEL
jgi:hypothetical protein